MSYLLGVDTGGTFTDAVILDEGATRVVAAAKALTSRPDLALGVGAAIDAVLAEGGIAPAEVALVSLSTTLATNALVEGQGGRVALVFIGFDPDDLDRDGLAEALRGDPVIAVAGGHQHGGGEVAPLDEAALRKGLEGLPAGITGVAVAARFATRNPAHELRARDLVRAVTGLPVTCSHELSAGLGGPKRALTAVLNARLVGLIARLIAACEAHLAARGIVARLMVVRGDGALIPAAEARERPIETILSGPAASIAGAGWLTGLGDALVSDIGGTTTDVCLLRDGRPAIDPEGARVGPFRTMVEAVAMRTTGLGGDSEVQVEQGLDGGLRLGPRRVMPVSLLAVGHPALVHGALDRALASETVAEAAGRFVLPLWLGGPPAGLDPREASVAARLLSGPCLLAEAMRTRVEAPALARLVGRGLVAVADVTPSDASHVLGLQAAWDAAAAEKALDLLARRRNGRGERIAAGAREVARAVITQLQRQTEEALLEAAFAEDGRDWGGVLPERLARHPLTRAGLDRHRGILRAEIALGVPVVGLGASAATHYPEVGRRLGTEMVIPPHAHVANAVGAVVGLVAMVAEGTVTGPGPGLFIAHLPEGPQRFSDRDDALAAMEAALSREALDRAAQAGVVDAHLSVRRDLREVEVEGQPMFIEAQLRVTAQGRPRIAAG